MEDVYLSCRNQMIEAPKVSANLALDYTVPVGTGELLLHTDASYKGSQYFSAFNEDKFPESLAVADSFEEVNARFAYRDASGKFEIDLVEACVNLRLWRRTTPTGWRVTDFNRHVHLWPQHRWLRSRWRRSRIECPNEFLRAARHAARIDRLAAHRRRIAVRRAGPRRRRSTVGRSVGDRRAVPGALRRNHACIADPPFDGYPGNAGPRDSRMHGYSERRDEGGF